MTQPPKWDISFWPKETKPLPGRVQQASPPQKSWYLRKEPLALVGGLLVAAAVAYAFLRPSQDPRLPPQCWDNPIGPFSRIPCRETLLSEHPCVTHLKAHPPLPEHFALPGGKEKILEQTTALSFAASKLDPQTIAACSLVPTYTAAYSPPSLFSAPSFHLTLFNGIKYVEKTYDLSEVPHLSKAMRSETCTRELAQLPRETLVPGELIINCLPNYRMNHRFSYYSQTRCPRVGIALFDLLPHVRFRATMETLYSWVSKLGCAGIYASKEEEESYLGMSTSSYSFWDTIHQTQHSSSPLSWSFLRSVSKTEACLQSLKTKTYPLLWHLVQCLPEKPGRYKNMTYRPDFSACRTAALYVDRITPWFMSLGVADASLWKDLEAMIVKKCTDNNGSWIGIT